MTLDSFNKLPKEEAIKWLLACCGSENWANSLWEKSPFSDELSLLQAAGNIWYHTCKKIDWLEAFTHHPKIGDTKMLSEKFASTKHLAANEQELVNEASQNLIDELAHANIEYEKRFGFIFIICATGKSASQMLRLLLDRISNTVDEEVKIAMGEQHKISILRLKKIIHEGKWPTSNISQLTTHVLDTSVGRPGEGITIRLKELIDGKWQTMAQGITNEDGRVADLLPESIKLLHRNYKLIFETERYFLMNHVKGFYPEIEIQFTISDDFHYHVPLLVNPFGYSTYRGS